MGHFIDREDDLGRELGLCTDIEHVQRSKGCTVANSYDLLEKVAEVKLLLDAVSREAEAAMTAWDRTTDYTDHGDAAERVRLARVYDDVAAMLRAGE